MRGVLKKITRIYVQHESSRKLLLEIGIEAITSGDTRYDRVLKNAAQAKKIDKIDAFVRDKKVIVCGSLWKPDLEIVAPVLDKLDDSWKIILTTHEIDEHHLREAAACFASKKLIRYSQLSDQNSDAQIVLIDNIGMLMHLYGYGHIAYVGGAFKTGLHNILEPASFGLPVIFGPHHQKFPEAALFIENGIGFSVGNQRAFQQKFDELIRTELRAQVLHFMKSQCGATEKILGDLK